MSSETMDALPALDGAIVRERTDATFNTFAIIAPGWHHDPERLGITPGADNDLVRLAVLTGGLSWIESVRLPLPRRRTGN